MDSNKDAAQNCMVLGNKALKDGDKERAFKFLSKALRLDPSLPLGSVLSSLRKDMKDTGCKDGHSQSQHDPSTVGTERTNSDSLPKVVSSAEQVEIVRRIRKTKDYYQILGLAKGCTSEEIRKAYRKISLKVHPDKNNAPGAEDAFKSVSKAFACLNDENLREKYDQYGPDESHRVAHQTSARYRGGGNGFAYDEMFNADDIFDSFFFGTPYASNAFQRSRYVRTQRTAAARQAEGGETHEKSGGLLTLLQLLPVLALFLISLIPLSSPVYSMEQVAPYQFQYSTREHQVPFFVKSQDFDRDYPQGSSSRRSVEAKVERDHMEILGYNCRRELSHRRWNPSFKTPNCDSLRSFYVQ